MEQIVIDDRYYDVIETLEYPGERIYAKVVRDATSETGMSIIVKDAEGWRVCSIQTNQTNTKKVKECGNASD